MALLASRRTVLAALMVLGLVAGVLAGSAVTAGPAAAELVCEQQAVQAPDGSIHYERVCREAGAGSDGGGGPSLADCGLGEPPPPPPRYAPDWGPIFGAWYCAGTRACAIATEVEVLVGMEPPPPGQRWAVRGCATCRAGVCGPLQGQWVLIGAGDARPLIVQALEAFGALTPPVAAVRHSPATADVVHLETWFWLDPATFAEARGTSAEGLVAIAEPDHTQWDPGDGSDPISCAGAGQPYTAGADPEQACTHTYTVMSPRYDGQVTRHWTVRYEIDGAPIDIPGAPGELVSPATPFALSVVETQVVTGN